MNFLFFNVMSQKMTVVNHNPTLYRLTSQTDDALTFGSMSRHCAARRSAGESCVWEEEWLRNTGKIR